MIVHFSPILILISLLNSLFKLYLLTLLQLFKLQLMVQISQLILSNSNLFSLDLFTIHIVVIVVILIVIPEGTELFLFGVVEVAGQSFLALLVQGSILSSYSILIFIFIFMVKQQHSFGGVRLCDRLQLL